MIDEPTDDSKDEYFEGVNEKGLVAMNTAGFCSFVENSKKCGSVEVRTTTYKDNDIEVVLL